MLRQGYPSHYLDGKGPVDRAKDAGYDCKAIYQSKTTLAENAAKHPRPKSRDEAMKMYGYVDDDFASSEAAARRLVRRWMESPLGHHRNIMDPRHTRIGVGVAIGPSGWSSETVFATQNFSVCE